MAAAVNDAAKRGWRPNPKLWLLLGAFVGGSVALTGLADWSDDHLFLVNTTDSLPNWAFLIERGRLPAKGEFIFFDPPASALLRRHFGARPRMFGKKRSEEHTSELQSLMRISYAVFCLKKKTYTQQKYIYDNTLN